MLTDEQIQERDPAALQMEVLSLGERITEVTNDVNLALDARLKAQTEYLKADARLRQEKNVLRELQERLKCVQSVLKSLPRE